MMSDESENRALRSRIATQENQIAHLEKTITQLRAELAEAKKGATRYEIVRRMNVPQFQSAFIANARTGKPFDQLIDELVPFVSKDKGDAPL